MLNILVACGPPGTDTFFAQQTKSTVATDTSAKRPAPVPARTPIATKPVKGVFKHYGDSMSFQPCGSGRQLIVFGSPMALFLAREKFRWVGLWFGAKLYAQFQGAIVVDTPSVKGGDRDTTGVGESRTRFLLVGVDSMRSWQSTDCGGTQSR